MRTKTSDEPFEDVFTNRRPIIVETTPEPENTAQVQLLEKIRNWREEDPEC